MLIGVNNNQECPTSHFDIMPQKNPPTPTHKHKDIRRLNCKDFFPSLLGTNYLDNSLNAEDACLDIKWVHQYLKTAVEASESSKYWSHGPSKAYWMSKYIHNLCV